ncbi:MAG: alpha/beta fold hydrolase [Caulobacter sp.]|nr:alpha/beta fold hydrolase [Caulobacter sp.]
MQILRTPDDRFENLPDFPFAPHYVEIPDLEGGRLRIHYLDEGPRDGKSVLLFHGEPTWCYLYRKMIPHLTAAGLRVLAPDLVGMGRSDKPAETSDYSYDRHVLWMEAWLHAVDVQGAIWFGQDWGSLIGLGMVTRNAQRFDGIVIANGLLPDMAHLDRMVPYQLRSPDPAAFGRWQDWIRDQKEIDAGQIVAEGVPGEHPEPVLKLSPAERAAYNAPFPDGRYQAGALIFPFLLNNLNAAGRQICVDGWDVLEKWTKPFVTAFGKADGVLGWADDYFQDLVPGAKGQPHKTFKDGRHFIQEEEPQALADAVIDVARRT